MKITKQQLKQIIVEELRDYYGGESHSQSERDATQPRRPEEVMREEVQALADKFNVEAFVEVASDGNTAILVFHQDGEPTAYNDTEEMYKDLADEIGRDIHGDPDRYEDEY
jgi:hypothetical protein